MLSDIGPLLSDITVLKDGVYTVLGVITKSHIRRLEIFRDRYRSSPEIWAMLKPIEAIIPHDPSVDPPDIITLTAVACLSRLALPNPHPQTVTYWDSKYLEGLEGAHFHVNHPDMRWKGRDVIFKSYWYGLFDEYPEALAMLKRVCVPFDSVYGCTIRNHKFSVVTAPLLYAIRADASMLPKAINRVVWYLIKREVVPESKILAAKLWLLIEEGNWRDAELLILAHGRFEACVTPALAESYSAKNVAIEMLKSKYVATELFESQDPVTALGAMLS